MKKARCVVALVTLLLIAGDTKSGAVDKEMKALQGEWKLVRAEAGGMQVISEKDEMLVVIKGDSLALRNKNGQDDMKSTIKIDPTAKIKTMDWATKRGNQAIDVPLIYSLEGDDLKFVMPLVEKGKGETPKRPDTFDTKDKPLMLFTLKRVKK
jgi:uncharacterized protein (TIGR03067 family)